MRIVQIMGMTVEEYDLEEIVPIPAKCKRCGYDWVGKDAIMAPCLEACRCGNCGGGILIPHPKHPKVVDTYMQAHSAQQSFFS